MKQNNDWLDVLRDKLEGAEVHSPSDAGWEGIRAAMDKRPKGKSGSRHRRRFLLIPAAAAVAALLIVFATRPTKEESSLLSSNNVQENVSPNIESQQIAENSPLSEDLLLPETPESAKEMIPSQAENMKKEKNRMEKESREMKKETREMKKEYRKVEKEKWLAQSGTSDAPLPSSAKDKEPAVVAEKTSPVTDKSSESAKKSAETPKEFADISDKTVSISEKDVSENNVSAASSHTLSQEKNSSGTQRFPQSNPASDILVKPSSSSPKYLLALSASGVSGSTSQGGLSNMMNADLLSSPSRRAAPSLKGVLTKYDYAYSTFRHQMPVSLSATLSYWLGTFWGIESGLSFTRLKSDVIPMFGNLVYEQKVDYLGIPLRVNGRLPLSDNLTFYAGAGALGEYCLSASLDGEKQEERAFQYSLEAHAGLSYSLMEGYDVFCEPDILWYPTETNLRTIHSGKPWMASLRIGLRIGLP